MKKRNLITNILYVVILLALAGFLAVEFGVFSLDAGQKKWIASTALAVAIVSVALVEIILPVLSNRDMLKNKKYGILVAVKTLFFLAAAAVLFLYEPFGVLRKLTLTLILFVVFYFIQFFISLDPKVEKKPQPQPQEPEPEEEEEEDAVDIEFGEDVSIEDDLQDDFSEADKLVEEAEAEDSEED